MPRPLPWSDPLCRLLGGAAQGASREDDLLLAVDGMVRSERRLAGFRRLVKAAEAEAGVSEAAEASAVLADAVEGAGSSLEAQHAPGQVPRLQEPGLQRPVAAASGTGGLGPGAVVMGAATAQTAPSAATLAKRAVQELLNTWILPNKRWGVGVQGCSAGLAARARLAVDGWWRVGDLHLQTEPAGVCANKAAPAQIGGALGASWAVHRCYLQLNCPSYYCPHDKAPRP